MHRLRVKAWLLGAAILCATQITGALPAAAQEKIPLTMISGYPPSYGPAGAFADFQAAVDATLAVEGTFAIEWNIAHSGTIARPTEELQALEDGLGDIGLVITPFHFDRLPIYQIPYVTPFTAGSDPKVLVDVYKVIDKEYPEHLGWDALNLTPLTAVGNIDEYFIASRKEITGPQDLDGLKVGGAGPNLLWVTPLGAAGVPMALPDFYNAVSTGLVDAVMLWPQAIGAFKICGPAPHSLNAGFGTASLLHLVANSDYLSGLPAPVVDALEHGAVVYEEAVRNVVYDQSSASIQTCKDESGMTIVEVDADARRKWAETLPNLAGDWAARVQSERGIPGQQVLETYMAFMRTADTAIVTRDWDK